MATKKPDEFPKLEAGRLAVAADAVLRSTGRGGSLGRALAALSTALDNYDNKIIALTLKEGRSDERRQQRPRRSVRRRAR